MFDLRAILHTIAAAAAAKRNGAPTPAALVAGVLVLDDDAIAFVTEHLAPKLDIPPAVIAIAAGQAPAIVAAVEPSEVALLDLLIARVHALL